VETKETSELECSDTISFMDIDNDPTWMTPLINWLQGDVYSIPAADRHKAAKVKARRFILKDGILYKRAFSRPLLRCISQQDGLNLLREIHD